MPGRKRKFVGRQNLRPAMRLNLTRPRTRAQSLDRFEYKNSHDTSRSSRADRRKPLRPPKNRHHHAEPVPQPSIAGPRRANHPISYPPWRSPTVHPAHHSVIAPFDRLPEVACNSHRHTSFRHHPKFAAPFVGARNSPRSYRHRNPPRSCRGGACPARRQLQAPRIREALSIRPHHHANSTPTPGSTCHNIRGRFSPLSNAVVHFLQNRISFSQCPNVIAGTNTVSGTIPTAHGFS